MVDFPSKPDLTAQEAADVLGISRSALARLLDNGTIEYGQVGIHRRVRLEAVTAFRDSLREQRRSALRELTAISEEIGYR